MAQTTGGNATSTTTIASSLSSNPNAAIINHWSNFYGIPSWIPLSIAQAESGLNPTAQGDKNAKGQATSFGLFQLHVGGGQGDGFTPAQLQDPNLNSQIGIGHMVTAYKAGVAQNLTGYNLLQYVASRSGHPDTTGQMPSSYNTLLTNAYSTVTGQSTSSGTGGSTSGGTSTSSAPGGIAGTALKIFWGLAGFAIIILGVYLMFNPFADLTTAIRTLGKAAGGSGSILRSPLKGVTNKVNTYSEKVNPKKKATPPPKKLKDRPIVEPPLAVRSADRRYEEAKKHIYQQEA